MTTSRRIRMNSPMRKIHKGDVEDLARQNKDHFVSSTGSDEFNDKFDQINWNSRSGKKPTPVGYRVRYVTHAEAGLPVFGDP